MSLKYKDLQPWVDMLVDALENRGASSSGIPDIKVYPYAQQYREMLETIREKKVSKYHLDDFLNRSETEIMLVTIQPHRVKHLLESLRTYFYKEFTK
jgi:hypothetical protein